MTRSPDNFFPRNFSETVSAKTPFLLFSFLRHRPEHNEVQKYLPRSFNLKLSGMVYQCIKFDYESSITLAVCNGFRIVYSRDRLGQLISPEAFLGRSERIHCLSADNFLARRL